jgi:hypothetical protein
MACGSDTNDGPSEPPDPIPLVAGSYTISGWSTTDPDTPFFEGNLELTQSPTDRGPLSGTLFVSALAVSPFFTVAPITNGRVMADSSLSFLAGSTGPLFEVVGLREGAGQLSGNWRLVVNNTLYQGGWTATPITP